MNNKLLELARAVVHTSPDDNGSIFSLMECPWCWCDLEKGISDPPYTHLDDCEWLLLKKEVERLDALNESVAEINPRADFRQRRKGETDELWKARVSLTTKWAGEGLKFAEPCKPQPYEVK